MNSAGFTIFDPNYTIMMITRKIFRIVLATLLPVSVFAQSSDNQPTRPEKQFVLDYISKTESFEKFGYPMRSGPMLNSDSGNISLRPYWLRHLRKKDSR